MRTKPPFPTGVKKRGDKNARIFPQFEIEDFAAELEPVPVVHSEPSPRLTCRAPIRHFRNKREGFLNPKTARLVRSCMRARGYLVNSLKYGAPYKIWCKHQFHRKTKQKDPLTVQYIEEVMRTFRKTTTEFDIEIIRWKGSPRLKIMHRGTGPLLTENGIRCRLIRYIRGALRIHHGRPVKVDAYFLNHFIATSQLPAEAVMVVADGLKYIPGCELRQRGVGGNFKLVVSLASPLQESSPPYGFPTERRLRNTVTAAPSGGQGKTSDGRRPIAADKDSDQSCPPDATAQPLPLPPARRVPAGNPTGAQPMQRLLLMWKKFADPIEYGGRWMSGIPTLRLAIYAALGPMRSAHRHSTQVVWRMPHAVGFAARALRLGHRKEKVLAAYQLGVQASHEDALDAIMRGKESRGGSVGEITPREPSAAVAYAWQELRRDGRSPGQRWAEIFAGDRAGPLPRVRITSAEKKSRAAAAPQMALQALPPRDREKFRGLKTLHGAMVFAGDAAAPADAACVPTAQELLAHLAARGMKLEEFKQLPHSAQKRVLQVVQAKRTAGGWNKK